MIYILGKHWLGEDDELDEVINIASTDIQDILNYLNLEDMQYHEMTDKMIVIKPNNIEDDYTLSVRKDMIDSLEKYASYFIRENHDEYEDAKQKVSVWCNMINKELEVQRLREEEDKKRREEARERAMYEKLKAKFES